MDWINNFFENELTPVNLAGWFIENDSVEFQGLDHILRWFLATKKVDCIDLDDWPQMTLSAGVQETTRAAPEWLRYLADQIPFKSRTGVVSHKAVLHALIHAVHSWAGEGECDGCSARARRIDFE